jgi:hypothetical protein
MEQLRKLIQYCKDTNPEVRFPKASEELIVHLETVLLPHLVRVIKRDNALFEGDERIALFPGLVFTWKGTDEGWRVLHIALLYAVLHGDPKEKFGKIIEQIKTMIPGAQVDQVTAILEDTENQDSLKEMIDLVMNTRLASVVGDLVQTLTPDTDLGINFEDPNEIIALMRDPSGNPAVKEMMDRAQLLLKERIETGKINQKELIREIEMLRAKMTSKFGKYMNEMIVGAREQPATGNTSDQLLSNSPEARRARMVARLQRKHAEKYRK